MDTRPNTFARGLGLLPAARVAAPRLVRQLVLIVLAALSWPTAAQAQGPKTSFWQDLHDARNPTRSVTYKQVGKQKLVLDLFEPTGHTGEDRRACFVVVHGGGWVNGTPRAVYPLAFHFADRGLVGISVQYRLYDPVKEIAVADCVKDVRSAIRYIRAHADELGIDPERIIVAGSSAGGHLAVGAALFDGVDAEKDDRFVSCAPAALVLLSAVLNAEPNEDIAYKECKSRLGADWQRLCPTQQMSKGLPPTLVLHASDDKITPIEGIRRFLSAARTKGQACEQVITTMGGHGHYQLTGDSLREATAHIESFLAGRKFIDPLNVAVDRTKSKDAQLRNWPVGAIVEGERDADVPGGVKMIGHVVRSDERRLEVMFTESWISKGKRAEPRVLWVWERREAKSGRITYENIEQRHIGKATERFNIRGTVTLNGKKLTGDYEHDYRFEDNQPVHSQGPRDVEFVVRG